MAERTAGLGARAPLQDPAIIHRTSGGSVWKGTSLVVGSDHDTRRGLVTDVAGLGRSLGDFSKMPNIDQRHDG